MTDTNSTDLAAHESTSWEDLERMLEHQTLGINEIDMEGCLSSSSGGLSN